MVCVRRAIYLRTSMALECKDGVPIYIYIRCERALNDKVRQMLMFRSLVHMLTGVYLHIKCCILSMSARIHSNVKIRIANTRITSRFVLM